VKGNVAGASALSGLEVFVFSLKPETKISRSSSAAKLVHATKVLRGDKRQRRDKHPGKE